ncbi:hypothetical protein FSP39_013920 [Pinctada imbricata]|uniref:GH10 domain-containing protein n=1 Tax=Pinctada imbricata TaxID=66713 RepID=A0AA88XFM5_PINIB|nr:hypothetical protein FSP39_013920 [Pinctada imbricata]
MRVSSTYGKKTVFLDLKTINHRTIFPTSVQIYTQMDPSIDFLIDDCSLQEIPDDNSWLTEAQARINQIRKAPVSIKMKVRGHNMFWGDDGHVPYWVKGLNSADLLQAMQHHVNSMVSHTRGKLEHWDVNNENLHGDFYERHTGNPDITAQMFKWIHTQESGVKLFLNDYGVAVKSQYTTVWTPCLSFKASAYRDQAIQLKKEGIPIYGMGVQGHFYGSDIDIVGLKYRLDLLAEAGLPIWITELTIQEQDENKKAKALESLITLFFSHPAVEGVLLWGFWDHAMKNTAAAITTGSNVTPNAAGVVYQRLYGQDWKTDFSHAISSHGPVTTSAFMGDYSLKVKNNNHVIHTETFTLDKAGKNLTIHLQGTYTCVVVSGIRNRCIYNK